MRLFTLTRLLARPLARRVLAPLTVVVLLAACASDTAPPPSAEPQPQDQGMVQGLIDMVSPSAGPVCPQLKVMTGTGWITQFADDIGRDITDIVTEGELLGFDGGCSDNGKGGLTVNLMVRMNLTLGPAAKDRVARVPYMVALVKGRDVLAQQRFDIAVEFPANLNRATHRDNEVVLNVPLQPGESGTDYDIYVGFVLTPDQLEYNKNRL